MIEASFKRNLNHNYLTIKSEEEGHLGHQAKMLSANQIKGLLPYHTSIVNDQAEYCYEISSRQPMGIVFQDREINYDILESLIRELIQLLRRMEEYLLDGSSLVLEQDYIFINPETNAVFFCLVPHWHKPLEKAVHELAAYLLERVDHQDERAVMLVYKMYRISSGGRFTPQDLSELLTGNSKLKFKDSIKGYRNTRDNINKPEMITVYQRDEEEKEGNLYGDRKAIDWGECQIEAERDQPIATETKRQSEECQDKIEKGCDYDEKHEKKSVRNTLFRIFVVFDIILLILCASLYWRERAVSGQSIPDASGVIFRLEPQVRLKILAAVILTICVITVCLVIHFSKKTRRTLKKAESKDGISFEEDNKEEIFKEEDIKEMMPELFERDGLGAADPKQEETGAQVWDEDFTENKAFCGDTVLLTEELMNQMNGCPNGGPRMLVGQIRGKELQMELTKMPYYIGKLEGNVDGVIKDRSVSRIHARIHEEKGKYYLTDLNSTNGTTKNDMTLEAYQTVEIMTGDKIGFAKIIVEFR